MVDRDGSEPRVHSLERHFIQRASRTDDQSGAVMLFRDGRVVAFDGPLVVGLPRILAVRDLGSEHSVIRSRLGPNETCGLLAPAAC